jgi:uncharacterized protein (TIGR04376 family)
MGLFDDFSRFLETRLEEFLRNNPHLELQALEEQLREQEEGTLRLMGDLQVQEKALQGKILATAQEIQRWHTRIEKAKVAGRFDLVTPAQEREADLLRQGNQLWGKMQGIQARAQQAKTLLAQIQARRQEVRATAATARAQATPASPFWSSSPNSPSSATDPLEQTFRRWETEEELDRLKRDLRNRSSS